ncbi:MAG: electron transport complex subunit RsxC [Pseudomonadota bacterium]
MSEIPVTQIDTGTHTQLDVANRKVWPLPGGVHPPENKAQSLQHPIKPMSLPAQLVFPLSQHIGAPALACVNVGDQVLRGQVIAQAKGFVSVPVHASSSGTVVAIEERPIAHASGLHGMCIVVEPDGQHESIEFSPIADYTQCSAEELLDTIRNAGIAGMGGAGFPSAVKLNAKQPIDTLIINATECEPYITADDALIRERSSDVLLGIQILKHIVQPSQEVLIGIEDNKPEAIAQLRAQCTEHDQIHVVVFPTKYPSGGEKQLIKILTGREVPSGGLPADIGIVCQNIGTCEAIKKAVVDGEPLTSRVTTVTGETVSPQNYDIALGTPVSHALAESDYQAQGNQPVIMGGPMMGFALANLDIPVVKTTNCILAPSVTERPPNDIAQACIRCGMCAEACPVSLLPQQLYWFSRSQNNTQLEKHNLFDCIECGACSYSCPSHIPLVQYYRSSKAEIRAEKADQEKSEKAKQRFELRQERLEREEREKEERRKARKEAALKAKASPSKQDVISDAIARTQAKKNNVAQADKSAPAAADSAKALDPAAAAIERAKQKRAEPATEQSPEDTLKTQIATLEKRIAKANDKMAALETSDSTKIDALKSGLALQQQKLDDAKAQLAAISSNAVDSASAPATDEPMDAAQAAIARAQQARAEAGNLSDDEKRAQQLTSIDKRLSAQQAKYDELLSSDPDKAELIKASLDKLQAKKAALLEASS